MPLIAYLENLIINRIVRRMGRLLDQADDSIVTSAPSLAKAKKTGILADFDNDYFIAKMLSTFGCKKQQLGFCCCKI